MAAENKKVTCSFCLQDLIDMVDPRELPCGHVFCLGCLKDDYSRCFVNAYQCSVCRRKYTPVAFNALPKAKSVRKDVCEAKQQEHCGRCKVEQPATAYCVDCGEKICSKHMKYHEGYFDGTHETLDIKEYTLSPKKYRKLQFMCNKHEKQIFTMACNRCFQFNCSECHQGSKDCFGGTSYTFGYTQVGRATNRMDHIYQPLEVIEKDIKAKIQQKLNTVSANLDDIARKEKEDYRRMDTVENECKRMIGDVKRVKMEYIQQITNQTTELEKQINTYQSELTTDMVQFLEENNRDKESLKKVMKTTNEFCGKEILELIKGHKQVINAQVQPVQTVPGYRKTLRIGSKRQMDVQLQTSTF